MTQSRPGVSSSRVETDIVREIRLKPDPTGERGETREQDVGSKPGETREQDVGSAFRRISRRWLAAIVPVVVGCALALAPAPSGLTPHAWRYFALFAAVIVALILEPVPAAGVGFIGMAVAAASRLVAPEPGESLRWALSGFANGTVWLVFGAFVFALGYEKTGLGRRIALLLVRRLGGSTIGLGYAITFADVILAPFTPSNTARSAGTIFPIVQNIPPLYDSHPGESARHIGGYLMWTSFAATCVTSSFFATALAPNLLALELVRRATGASVSVAAWVAGFWPVGCLLVALVPLLAYWLYPPEVKRGDAVTRWAGEQLAALGPLTRREITMAALAVLAIVLWMTADRVMDAATVALIVISLMMLFGVVSWDEIVGYGQAWTVLVLMATLFTLADGLSRVGFVGWFAKGAVAGVAGLSPAMAMAALATAFFLIHYMFASVTAHTAAVLPVMLASGALVPGLPIRTFALLLCYSLGLMGVITPYATGPAPVYYSSGYISRAAFWRLGLVFGLVFLAVLLGVGLPYLSRTTNL